MSNLNDYIMWRGDLSFIQSPFCEVDGAIFSTASYFDYDIIIDDDELPLPVSYKSVVQDYVTMDGDGDIKLGLIMPTEKYLLQLKLMAKSPRFRDIEISDFVNEVNVEGCYQFCAMTFHLSDGSMAVVFRGTDDTFIGWREDFCLSYMERIPSQKLAVRYLKFVAEKYPNKPIYICGHSKGGNLAIYSTVFAPDDVRSRIVKAYSYDGPGLSDSIVESKGYADVAAKLCVLLPHSATIGAMFNNGSFKVVKSRGSAAYQHDLMNWEIRGPRFVKLRELSKTGQKNLDSFKEKMSAMTLEEKENFSNLFFAAIEKTGARTLLDLNEAKLKNFSVIVKSIGGLSKEDREFMLLIVKKLLA